MGSLFVTQEDRTVKGFAGKEYAVPFYLQFVPGVVVEVVHSEESFRYSGDTTINSIIAKPHITDKLYKRRSTLGEKDRYYPLFRLHSDIPSKGDPVLLCTIGRINYYMGPLNTRTNNPTWNDDPQYVPEITFTDSEKTIAQNPITAKGQSENFNRETLYPRLIKKQKKELDYGKAIKETTGDTLFEGRHGNSIRIGSRSNNPYVFISNKRHPWNKIESINDGSLLSIISNGTINQHLGGGFNSDGDLINFKLSSDSVEDNNYPIGDIYTSVNAFSDDSFIYSYNSNQMLLHSDRITLNSKLDDIFVSSIKDIHIGSGRHLSISAPKSVNVLSDNVNIGNPKKATMESMVLGEKLKEVLTDIINLIPTIKITTMLGPQVPLPDIQAKITQITNKIESITSTKHKIEQG